MTNDPKKNYKIKAQDIDPLAFDFQMMLAKLRSGKDYPLGAIAKEVRNER